ncbi:S-adenosyl-L-methionine-dependent methyltransferase, partial [Vararia minispora EC-137]
QDGEMPTGSEHGDDGASTSSSESLVSLRSEEFPTYFGEHYGRLFHSHGNSPSAHYYILPVDGHELHRYNATHTLLRRVTGVTCDAPIAEALADAQERRRTVVDLCTGTGLWPMELARAFPYAAIRALDRVPIATRYPAPNVRFELADVVAAPLRFADASVDVVHARNTHMTPAAYARLLSEAARVLRPGGLFIAGEWGEYPAL